METNAPCSQCNNIKFRTFGWLHSKLVRIGSYVFQCALNVVRQCSNQDCKNTVAQMDYERR